MKLKTRVLSLVLAGSMMLSVVPVSAFAETGTANAASAAVQSDVPANGVYATEQPGSILISARGCSIQSQDDVTYHSNSCYVVNSHDDQAIPRLTIDYNTMPTGHKVIAWRVSMPGKSTPNYGYTDQGLISQLKQLAEVGYEESADHKTVFFNCVRSVTYNGKALAAIDSPVYFNPVLNVTADDLTFDHGFLSFGGSFLSSEAATLHQKFIKVQPDGNVNFNDSSSILTEFPKEAGTYQAFATLSSNSTDPRVPNWNGERYYEIDAEQVLTSNDWRFTVDSGISLSVNGNGQPVIPDGTTGVHYSGSTLTIDDGTTVRFGYGTPVKCNIENNGVLDGGLFTGTVTNHGVIESGLFVNKPENATSAKFSFTSGATFCGLKDPSGITSLYAVRTENGQNLHLTASYSNPSRDPFGWVQAIDIPNTTESAYLLYKNPNLNPWTVDVWGDSALPEGETDVATTFTPVAYMNSSDLSIDSTGKVSISIPEVEATGVTYTNTATKETFTSYPTAAGDYVAHVSLKCTRDWNSLANKDPIIPASALLADDGVAALSEEQENQIYRIALKGDLYYFVPETLEVPFEVKVQPELNIVDGLPDTIGMEADAEGVYTSKNWSYNNNTNTLSVTNSSYFETFTGLVSCKVVAGEGVKISNGYFMDTVTFDGGTVDGGWFAKEPVGCAPSDVHSIAYADGTTKFTVNETLTVTKIWYGGPLKVNISTETPIYSVSDKYLPHQTTSLTYTSEYPRDYVLNSLPAPVLSTFTLSGVTDAHVMLDTTCRLDMTNPQKLHEGVQVTVKADACDADHQVEWVATGLELSEEQKHSAELTFTMPGNPVTLTATYPSIHKVPTTDSEGNVTIPEGTDEVKGDGWTAKKDDKGKTTVEITDGTNLGNTTLNCNKITIGSAGRNTTVSNLTTSAEVTVISGSTIDGGTFSGNVTSAGEIKGGTFEKDVTTTGTITGGAFNGAVSGTGTIEGGTFSGVIGSEVTINGGTFTGNVDSTKITGGVFAGEIPATVESTKVTATGGASINNIQKNEGTNQETAVQVVGEQKLSLAYTPDTGRTFYGWKETAGGDPTLNTDSSTITINQNDATERTFTPVVVMNEKDLTAAGESKITGVTVTSLLYYPVNDAGEITGEGSAERPTEDGSYILVAMLELSSQEPSENGIALFAAENTDLSRVVEQDGIGYYVPERLTVERITNGEDVPSDTGSGDSGAGGAAVAVIGGAAIGGAAYLIGTQVYLTSVLPEGASIPTNRQQLADLLWTAAGKPQPASTALFTDISAEAADSQKAARWCVEQGLLKDTGSTFKPDKHTFRPQVIKAWNDLQAKLNPQK